MLSFRDWGWDLPGWVDGPCFSFFPSFHHVYLSLFSPSTPPSMLSSQSGYLKISLHHKPHTKLSEQAFLGTISRAKSAIPTEGITPRVKTKLNYGIWMIRTCHCWSTDSHNCTFQWGMLIVGEGSRVFRGEEVNGRSLCFLPNLLWTYDRSKEKKSLLKICLR